MSFNTKEASFNITKLIIQYYKMHHSIQQNALFNTTKCINQYNKKHHLVQQNESFNIIKRTV